MTNTTYGSKFQTTDRYASAADLAARMRSDIKAAIAAGQLPGRVSNYSVRVDNYSMGRSIDIVARDFDGMWVEGTDRWGHPARILTLPGQKIKATLERIHRAYNYDNSDVTTDYFDVNYYGDVRIEDESSRARRLAEAEKAKARRAAPKSPKIDRKAARRPSP